MPLLVGSPIPLVIPVGVEIPGNVERQGPGTITATWIDPEGLEWPLTVTDTEPGWFTTFGPGGWGSTPIELITDPNPRGGDLVRYIRAKSRRLQWPLYIGGTSHVDFTTNYRTIMRAFTKTTLRRSPGVLQVARPDGSRRVIEAFYEQGFEGEPGENWLWAKPVVQLFCPDGYWTDPELVGMDSSFDPGVQVSFLNPFFSLTASAVSDPSGTGSWTPAYNNGDIDCWPAWILRGPFNGFVAHNLTTGDRFGFNMTVTTGQRVVITTDPPTVRHYLNASATTGTNVSRYIDWFNTAGTSLWPLIPGENRIDFTVTGGSVGTSVEMVWRHRYESA